MSSPNRTITKSQGSKNPQLTKTKSNIQAPANTSQARRSIYGASRAGILSANRRHTHMDKASSQAQKPAVQIFDETGKDVTPLPMIHHEPPTGVKGKQGNILDSSVGTPTDFLSQGGSVFQTTMTASAAGPFTRSVMTASQTYSDASGPDEFGEPGTEHDGTLAEVTRVIHEAPPVEVPTEEDLERIVELELEETSTIWLLDIPGTCVAADSEEAQVVTKQNEDYKQLVKSRAGNDRYVERSMNTFNYPLKTKITQTTRISHADVSVTATNWDMYDTFQLHEELAKKASEDDVIPEISGSESDTKHKETEPPEATSKVAQSTDDMTASAASAFGQSHASALVTIVTQQDESRAKKDKEILESDELKETLVIMERIIALNLYQPKQALYRGYDIIEDIDALLAAGGSGESIATTGTDNTGTGTGTLTMTAASKQAEEAQKSKKEKSMILAQSLDNAQLAPFLDRLWDYKCPLTKGRNVSCMVWNKLNPDLLAVGYGQYEYTKQKPGLICCWSIKNPEWPERIYTTVSGVTSIDFSTMHPNLLAAGLHDGTIAVYNVAKTIDEPMIDSLKNARLVLDKAEEDQETAGKHTGPVWQLRWVEKERGASGEEHNEVLVSVSTDGRITQWSIRKGFESHDLMRLKREATKTQGGKSKKLEALISKHAGGFSFDFMRSNTNIYLAGTEEGSIHKCSCSYNEQYLDSYNGHAGPVYKIQWSPFTNDVFLSCSGDWTARLWHQDRTSSVLKFQSATKSMQDICWSPASSLVFATVNTGAVEIWDLGQNVLDPTTSMRSPREGVSFSSVLFSQNSDCVLVGDSDGSVSVLQLKNMGDPPENQAEMLHKVIKSCLASQLKK